MLSDASVPTLISSAPNTASLSPIPRVTDTPATGGALGAERARWAYPDPRCCARIEVALTFVTISISQNRGCDRGIVTQTERDSYALETGPRCACTLGTGARTCQLGILCLRVGDTGTKSPIMRLYCTNCVGSCIQHPKLCCRALVLTCAGSCSSWLAPGKP